MKNIQLIKIILPFIIVIVLSIWTYQFLADFSREYVIDDKIVKKVEVHFHYKILIQCFSVFFTSISLPFLLSVFATKWQIDKSNWWKVILILEFTGLLIFVFTSPPDLFSTIMLFAAWQLPIIVNLLSLLFIINKTDKRKML